MSSTVSSKPRPILSAHKYWRRANSENLGLPAWAQDMRNNVAVSQSLRYLLDRWIRCEDGSFQNLENEEMVTKNYIHFTALLKFRARFYHGFSCPYRRAMLPLCNGFELHFHTDNFLKGRNWKKDRYKWNNSDGIIYIYIYTAYIMKNCSYKTHPSVGREIT